MIDNIETIQDAEDMILRLGAVVKYYNGKIHRITQRLNNKRTLCSFCMTCARIVERNKYYRIVRGIERELDFIRECMENGYYEGEKKCLIKLATTLITQLELI